MHLRTVFLLFLRAGSVRTTLRALSLCPDFPTDLKIKVHAEWGPRPICGHMKGAGLAWSCSCSLTGVILQ